MQYDFKKVRAAWKRRGWTLAEWAKLTNPPIHYSTIAKALARETAHPRTVKSMIGPLGLEYVDTLTNGNGRKSA